MRRGTAILIAVVFALCLCACEWTVGTVRETLDNTGYTVTFDGWSGQATRTLALERNATLQVEIVREEGDIRLDISDTAGREAYSGNGLETGIFTVTVDGSGACSITISGQKAGGSIRIRPL